MVRHIGQNHTECVTSGDAHLEPVQRGSSPSWREIVLWGPLRGYPGVLARMVLATGVSYKLHHVKTCDQSSGLYEYSTRHSKRCTMTTSFPTHQFIYILPEIICHPDVENPVNDERIGIDPLACPIY